jgi:hypothetical protein
MPNDPIIELVPSSVFTDSRTGAVFMRRGRGTFLTWCSRQTILPDWFWYRSNKLPCGLFIHQSFILDHDIEYQANFLRTFWDTCTWIPEDFDHVHDQYLERFTMREMQVFGHAARGRYTYFHCPSWRFVEPSPRPCPPPTWDPGIAVTGLTDR